MDDQRDYAEEVANRTLMDEEMVSEKYSDINYEMSTMVDIWYMLSDTARDNTLSDIYRRWREYGGTYSLRAFCRNYALHIEDGEFGRSLTIRDTWEKWGRILKSLDHP